MVLNQGQSEKHFLETEAKVTKFRKSLAEPVIHRADFSFYQTVFAM